MKIEIDGEGWWGIILGALVGLFLSFFLTILALNPIVVRAGFVSYPSAKQVCIVNDDNEIVSCVESASFDTDDDE